MASYRKRGRVWYFTFIDHDGRKVERKGCTDKQATVGMSQDAETRARRIRNGEISARDADLPKQERRPLEEHIQAFEAMLQAKRSTAKHIHMTTRFIREIARFSDAETAADVTAESVTAALLSLQANGLSARTIAPGCTTLWGPWSDSQTRSSPRHALSRHAPRGPMANP